MTEGKNVILESLYLYGYIEIWGQKLADNQRIAILKRHE